MADNLQVPKDLSDEKSLRAFLIELTSKFSINLENINKNSIYISYELIHQVDSIPSYTEVTYNTRGLIVRIDIWDYPSKTTKLFTKVITYSNNQIASIKITNEQTNEKISKIFTYDIKGNISIEEISLI
jgi:hypothetical protein